jgi:hypothetical protein
MCSSVRVAHEGTRTERGIGTATRKRENAELPNAEPNFELMSELR